MSQSSKVTKIFGSVHVGSSEVRSSNTVTVGISSTPAPVTLGAAVTSATAAQVLSGILIQNPSAAHTVTLTAVSDYIANIPDAQGGDSFRFSVINTSSSNAITLAADATGSIVGNAGVATSTTASFTFKLSADMSSYTVYRA
jgi:hypothetical protein